MIGGTVPIIWLESFDTYIDTNQADDKYFNFTFGGSAVLFPTYFGAGRVSKTSYRAVENTKYEIPRFTNTHASTGIAIKIPQIPDTPSVLFEFVDSGGDPQVELLLLPDGYFEIRALGKTAGYTPKIRLDTWFYLEMWVQFNQEDGAVLIRFNEVDVVLLTGLNTGPVVNGVNLNLDGGTDPEDIGHVVVDDWYVQEGSDALLGDLVLETLAPVEDVFVEWTTTGSDHYTEIDDIVVSDDDGSGISTNTSDELDLFKHEKQLRLCADIVAVWQEQRDERSTSGTDTYRNAVRVNEVDYFGPTITVDYTSYEHNQTTWLENPETNEPWRLSEIHASAFGVEFID